MALTDGGFEIVPTRGNDYGSKAAAMADWDAGKDFKVRATGQSINKANAERTLKGKDLLVRYRKLSMVFVLTV